MNEMEKTILDYVIREYAGEDEEITSTTPLISGGIVDSFSLVSLKRFLESRYKITIPNERATPEAFDTVQKVALLVQELLK